MITNEIIVFWIIVNLENLQYLLDINLANVKLSLGKGTQSAFK